MGLNYKQLDMRLIMASLLLSMIGILLIYSAQFDAATGHSANFFMKQIIWLTVAMVIFAIQIHFPLKMFDFLSYFFYIIAILLLGLVFLVGEKKLGATRWLSFGNISITPSEIAKLAFMFALARFLAYSKLKPESLIRLIITAILAIIPFVLVLLQPDLGTSIVFFVLLLSLWFWSGLSPFYIILIISPMISLIAAFHWMAWIIYLVLFIGALFIIRPGAIFGFIALISNLTFGILTPILWNKAAYYQKLRILTLIDPMQDPRGAGYQIIQSKIAVGSGGVIGKGFLEGSQSHLKFLPERHTDFIFSVLGEEFGFFGTFLVILLFGYIFYRGVRIAVKCRSKFASTLAWGALTILVFQFFVNVGMTLGLTPVTGLPLPFLSYGGTSLVLTWILVGFLVLADYHWTEY